VKRALLALVLTTSACTSAISGTATPLTGNLAVVNGPGTAAALAGVKAAAEAVFSYDSANPAGFDQAVAANVTGAAKEQLTTLFDQIRKSPQTVHLVARVREAAAVEFTGDRVRELAVLEQQNSATAGLAAVLLTAVKADGRWRLSDLAVNPAQPAQPVPAPRPDDTTPSGLRDSALAGARTIAGGVFTTDSADPDGSYARVEAVLADPLLSNYRANKATNVDAIRRSGTKVALGPSPVAGVLVLTGGRALVLFFTTLQVTDATGKVVGKPFTAELDVVREGAGWKATAVRPVTG
jgi:Mce-associated membrane protein